MEWISVKDRLPKDYQEVLTCGSDAGVIFSTYDSGHFWDLECDPCHVTHWMPFPEPFKQEPEPTEAPAQE